MGGDVADQSFQFLAPEGRYLIAGFSGGATLGERPLQPRRAAWGNLTLIGVMMACAEPNPALQRAGFAPFPPAVGEAVHGELVRWLAEGTIRPVIGRRVEFRDVPAALEDLEARRTLGRTVVHVAGSRD